MTIPNSPKPESSISSKTGTWNKKIMLVLDKIWSWIKKIPPVYPVFIVIIVGVAILNPAFLTANGIFLFLKRSSSAVILAVGELFVLASGGFDLSIGAMVTFVTIGSAMIINNDPNNALPAILILILFGQVVGFLNGFITAFFRVPSFIVTLGMQLAVTGAALYWCGGGPQGHLSDNFRALANGFINNIPIIGRFPIAVIILIVLVGLAYYLFHHSNFGRQILAIGDNQVAAKLSGVKVRLVRILTFMFSSFFAVVGGILVAGYGGINSHAGTGLELNAIAAAVLGGTASGGGRGSVFGVAVGSLAMEALFTLLNFLGLPKALRDAIQGAIIIAAVAYLALNARKRK